MKTELVTPSFANGSFCYYDSHEKTTDEFTCDWHVHSELELFLLLCGPKSFSVNRDAVELGPGDIIFVNDKVAHKTVTPAGSMGILIQFNEDAEQEKQEAYRCLKSILGRNQNGYKVFRQGTAACLRLTDCIQKIRLAYRDKQKSYEYYIKAYIQELTAILYRNDALLDLSELRPRVARMLPVFEYVNVHYHEPISLGVISSLLNFDKSHFCRVFKKTMGISFVEYLNLVRLDKSKELLRSTEKSITEIAYEVGFATSAYFIKIFKKHNFCTPNMYRKMQQLHSDIPPKREA